MDYSQRKVTASTVRRDPRLPFILLSIILVYLKNDSNFCFLIIFLQTKIITGSIRNKNALGDSLIAIFSLWCSSGGKSIDPMRCDATQFKKNHLCTTGTTTVVVAVHTRGTIRPNTPQQGTEPEPSACFPALAFERGPQNLAQPFVVTIGGWFDACVCVHARMYESACFDW